MTTLYRRPKKDGVFYVGVPTRSGGWVKLTTGTRVTAKALPMSRMLDELGPKGRAEWDLLDALRERKLTVPDLLEAWSCGPLALDRLRASLTDSDANELIPDWLKAIRDNLAADTVQHYSTHVRTMIPAGARYAVTRITRVEIAKWLHSLECSTSTKRKYRAAMSSFCNYLVEIGEIAVNPVLQVKAPKAGRSRISHLEHFQVIQLVEIQPEPYRTISALMHGTGMEISAALRITRGELDTKTWMVRAQGTKTSSRDRQAYVVPWVRPYLERHISGLLPGALLFPGVTRWAPAKAHAKACEQLDIRDYTLRDSRHTFAVGAAKAGVPAQLIAQQLGHADTQMVTKVYMRFQPTVAEMARMFDRVESLSSLGGIA